MVYNHAMSTVFFHIDLDAFFASVEILDDPSLRYKPVIIGSRGMRSVASTCSYEARKYGVHSAMPMATALKLCPDAVVIPPRMRRYQEKSREVMDMIRAFAPGFLQESWSEGADHIHHFPALFLVSSHSRRNHDSIWTELKCSCHRHCRMHSVFPCLVRACRCNRPHATASYDDRLVSEAWVI